MIVITVCLQLLWTDDMVTFVHRSRKELERLHRELLDVHGMAKKTDNQRVVG